MRSKPIKNPKQIGIAADHAGYQLKEELSKLLREANFEVIDFGDHKLNLDDDYPDFVVPLARAVAGGQVDRGVAICGSGVGVCIAANRVAGVRACLINEEFSARRGRTNSCALWCHLATKLTIPDSYNMHFKLLA